MNYKKERSSVLCRIGSSKMISTRTAASMFVLCCLVAVHLSSETEAVVGIGGRDKAPSPSPFLDIYIVWTERTGRSYHLSILASVLGSKNAARRAFVYEFSHNSAFAAKLTRKQASIMSKHPNVAQVTPPHIYYPMKGELGRINPETGN